MLDQHTLELPIGYDHQDAKDLEVTKRKRGQKVEVDEQLVTN